MVRLQPHIHIWALGLVAFLVLLLLGFAGWLIASHPWITASVFGAVIGGVIGIYVLGRLTATVAWLIQRRYGQEGADR